MWSKYDLARGSHPAINIGPPLLPPFFLPTEADSNTTKVTTSNHYQTIIQPKCLAHGMKKNVSSGDPGGVQSASSANLLEKLLRDTITTLPNLPEYADQQPIILPLVAPGDGLSNIAYSPERRSWTVATFAGVTTRTDATFAAVWHVVFECLTGLDGFWKTECAPYSIFDAASYRQNA